MGKCSRRQDGLRKQGISFFSSDSLDCREIWRYEDKSRRCDKLPPRTRVASTSFLRPLDPYLRANQMVACLVLPRLVLDSTTTSFLSSAKAAPWWIVMLVCPATILLPVLRYLTLGSEWSSQIHFLWREHLR